MESNTQDERKSSLTDTQSNQSDGLPKKHGQDMDHVSHGSSSSEYHFHAMLPQATPVSFSKMENWDPMSRSGSAHESPFIEVGSTAKAATQARSHSVWLYLSSVQTRFATFSG
jgi:hypothetical protein